MKDRRKALRREQDKELDQMLMDLRQDFQSHVIECTENSREVRRRLDDYHAQTKAKLESLNTVNVEQINLLNALVTAKRVSVWTGMAVKWLLGLLAAAAGALGLYGYFKPH